ncbi:MAG: toxin-antitoxin system protein [Lachnospiraceae bacterium]|nr:toxin-antitoxin system protein [Lachnospiraceae bacterium]
MQNQKPLKTKVSITLDDDLVNTLKGLAEKDDRSFSQYINMILRKHINEKNKKN